MAIAVAMLTASAARADTMARWRPFVTEASSRFGVPVPWIERVMRAESAGRDRIDGRPIRSSKGAIGLMQLMPSTWFELRAVLGLGNDPDDPRDNILAGTLYLRRMYDRFGYPGCFAAYNAGPRRYAAWVVGRQSLPLETITYIRKVGGPTGAAPIAAVSPSPSLFAVRHDLTPLSDTATVSPSAVADLFAVRRASQ